MTTERHAGGARPRLARAMLAVAVLGSMLAPSHAAGAPLQPSPPPEAAHAATVGPFTFALGPYELHDLPIERLYYYGRTLVPSCGLTDALGVAMYQTGGVMYNHPVAQARCALNMMRNHRIDPLQPAYLEQAKANAQRLLSLAVSHQNAIFFPYAFHYHNPHRGTRIPPWFSAMAQGQALSTFVRLYEWTGDAKWRTAADQTFRSFKVARQTDKPWVAGVENGRLWLDEYPSTPLDRVFNGHNFSMYGLYDYWRVTGNAEARLLALGAIHSSYVAASNLVRVPGGISFYCVSAPCLANNVKNPAYHPTHAGQLVRLYHVTRHWHFASLSEAFMADSPFKSSGRARLSAGNHQGYSFTSAGVGTQVASTQLAAASTYAFSRREVPGAIVKPGNGVWLYMSEGPLKDRWVRESAKVVPLGFVDDELDFYIPRDVEVEAGAYVARQFDSAGVTTATLQVGTDATTWTYDRYAKINGHPSIRMVGGPLAGHWLALDDRTLRDTTLFTDVDPSAFRQDIVWLTTKSITKGCSTYRYCPTSLVTREQMASFLARALDLPATSTDYFDDDETSGHESDINRVAAAGITLGCATDHFCPRQVVPRQQMASFIARALDLPAAVNDYFADDDGSGHEQNINRLAEAGITTGCGDARFCPKDSVRRDHMAAFLHRALSEASRITPPPPIGPASP